MTWLRVEDEGSVRWLVLANPGRRNAIPADGWEDLGRALADFEESPLRVLVLRGDGEDFCSGADLDGFGAVSGRAGSGSLAADRIRMKQVGEVATALHRLTKPSIAAVDGVAVGAGLNLALGCDVTVATDRARFAELFVRRGLTVDVGGTWLLPRVVGMQRAKELSLSGRTVSAAEALRIGLCVEVVEPQRLRERVAEIAESFLAGAPLAQMLTKQGLDNAWNLTFEEALGWEGQSQAICLATEDAAEGIRAFLEKRPPTWQGR